MSRLTPFSFFGVVITSMAAVAACSPSAENCDGADATQPILKQFTLKVNQREHAVDGKWIFRTPHVDRIEFSSVIATDTTDTTTICSGTFRADLSVKRYLPGTDLQSFLDEGPQAVETVAERRALGETLSQSDEGIEVAFDQQVSGNVKWSVQKTLAGTDHVEILDLERTDNPALQ